MKFLRDFCFIFIILSIFRPTQNHTRKFILLLCKRSVNSPLLSFYSSFILLFPFFKESDFKIYADYCKNYDTGEALIKQKMKKKKDLETLLTVSHCFCLISFLFILPHSSSSLSFSLRPSLFLFVLFYFDINLFLWDCRNALSNCGKATRRRT